MSPSEISWFYRQASAMPPPPPAAASIDRLGFLVASDDTEALLHMTQCQLNALDYLAKIDRRNVILRDDIWPVIRSSGLRADAITASQLIELEHGKKFDADDLSELRGLTGYLEEEFPDIEEDLQACKSHLMSALRKALKKHIDNKGFNCLEARPKRLNEQRDAQCNRRQ